MIWILLTAVLALILFWYKFVWPMNYFNRIGVKQTNPWPVLGDQWYIIFKKLSFGDLALKTYNMYPKLRYFGYYQFTTPTLVLRDPELIKQITVKDFDHFMDHRFIADPDADPLWANNLFSLRGEKWREMRATLSGSFTSSKMKHMFDTISGAAEHFVAHFLENNDKVISLEMKNIFTRYTNDVIATAAFGIEVDSLDQPDNTFYTMGKRIINFTGFLTRIKLALFFIMPKVYNWLRISLFDQDLTSYFKNIIYETIHMREKQGIVRKDMINLLLETRKGVKHDEENVVETGFAAVKEFTYLDSNKFKQLKTLSNDDITSQALIFFFAGFDTISTALCFGSYELALNPDVQDKLRKEIQNTHAANDNKLTYDALLNMKYLDQVFSEILRKWPPAVLVDRICTKPYTIEPKNPDEKPVKINVGDQLHLPIFGIHRDEQYYHNPEKFDPERFSDDNKKNIVPYTYAPFGFGPRNCIGSRFAILEAKALFYYLLLNFCIVPVDKTAIPLKLSRESLQHTAEGGFWLGLQRL